MKCNATLFRLLSALFLMMGGAVFPISAAAGEQPAQTREEPAVSAAQPGGSQEPAGKHVVGIGASAVYGENVSAARDQAVLNGLVNVLERVTSDLVPIDSLVSNFRKVNDTIFSQPTQYIQTYKVLTEAASGKVYRVMVEATVLQDKIRQHLPGIGLTLAKTDMPKVLFMVSEKNLESGETEYWWGEGKSAFRSVSAQSMTEKLRNRSFTVVDPTVRLQYMEIEPLYHKTDLSEQEAINLAARFQAEVVVVGTAASLRTFNTMGEHLASYKGNVAVRALRVDDGSELVSVRQTGLAMNALDRVGGNEALYVAGASAGEELRTKLAVSWRKAVKKQSLITITVRGTERLGYFVRFRKGLSEIRGVKSVLPMEMRANESLFKVDYEGRASDLATALMFNTFDVFGVNVADISEQAMRIELIPNP